MSRVKILEGDCRERVPELDACSVDSVITDPPYALVSITKRWSGDGPPPREGVYRRSTSGFMGKQWDTGETAFDPAFWVEVLRVLKPGGHLIAFGGTRTYHRLVCAIEDAGFEIRDQLAWLFGSGFPKSHNQDGEWEGWGTALKPAHEPICLARKPLIGTVAANLAQHRTGALNIDACRVEAGDNPASWSSPRGGIWQTDSTARADLVQSDKGRWPANVIHDGSPEVLAGFPDSKDGVAGERSGVGGIATEGLGPQPVFGGYGGEGSAARFFYSPKADKLDRLESKHPTVKPVDLMAYLIKLVTPPGGTVLDCFAGSGATGMAAMREGFDCILIEREAEYVADIERRLAHVHGHDTPLFADPKPVQLDLIGGK